MHARVPLPMDALGAMIDADRLGKSELRGAAFERFNDFARYSVSMIVSAWVCFPSSNRSCAKSIAQISLRAVDERNLISGIDLVAARRPTATERVLVEDDMAALFSLEMGSFGHIPR